MLYWKGSIARFMLCAAVACVATPAAQAGPLYDWLWQHHYNKLMRCAPRSFQAPAACCAPTCAQPATCQTTCTQTCQRVVVNYVPYTAYRTSWEQVPVTQYQQTCSTDPCTGCQVTCMKPCTTYTWQMKRVPYVTYRPVYRTEAYSVPVTYTSVAPSPCSTCATCPTCPTCAASPAVGLPPTGCSTCGPQLAAPVITGMPAVVPEGALTTNGSYTISPSYQAPAAVAPSIQSNGSTLAPADQVPTLGKPIIIDRREITPDSSSFQTPGLNPTNTGLQGVRPIRDPNPGMRWDNRAPLTNPEDQTAAAPTRQRWNYTPVRLASHQQAVSQQSRSVEPLVYRGQVEIERTPPPVNSAWKNLD